MRDKWSQNSKLETTEEAPIVARFLKARVEGIPRTRAARQTGLEHISPTTFIGMEWNALTYAGHTVWNVHNDVPAERAIEINQRGVLDQSGS